MNAKKLAVLLNAALAQTQIDHAAERCPPHRFQSGWMDNGESNAKGAIFCEMCGDIRPLEPTTVGAPVLETMDR